MAVDAVSNFDSELRLKRAADNQAPQGKCLSFKLDQKSYHQAIDYVCCNNCFEGNEDCVGRVYSSSHSNGYYCSSCGANQLNSARKTSEPFFCGDCHLQTLKENSCRKSYGRIPAGCWQFRACFENTCRNDGMYGSNQHYNPPISSGGVEGKINPDARLDGGGGGVVPALAQRGTYQFVSMVFVMLGSMKAAQLIVALFKIPKSVLWHKVHVHLNAAENQVAVSRTTRKAKIS